MRPYGVIRIPEHTEAAFRRYFEHGFEPGSFGMAVLRNDLFEAVMRADRENRDSIGNIVYWLAETAPDGSWGNEEIVLGWLNKNQYFEVYQKQLTFKIISED
jgi:hypothetical protein